MLQVEGLVWVTPAFSFATLQGNVRKIKPNHSHRTLTLANVGLHMLTSWKESRKNKRQILHQQQRSKCETESQCPLPPPYLLRTNSNVLVAKH